MKKLMMFFSIMIIALTLSAQNYNTQVYDDAIKTIGLVSIISAILGIIVLLCFFTLCANVNAIKNIDRANLNVQVNIAEKEGVEVSKEFKKHWDIL